MHSDCTSPPPFLSQCVSAWCVWCVVGGVDCRFRDKPDVFANQARQCAILSTSSAMLYDTPGQEDEDSGLRFVKITKNEYAEVLQFSEGMWARKQQAENDTRTQ
jgi:hypothetical protein